MSGYQTSSMIVVVVLIVSLVCTCRAQGMEYIGCYEDKDINNRVLNGPATKNEVNMTLKLCRNFCTLNSINTYFGTEIGYECLCGELPPFNRQVTTSQCDYDCTGDKSQKCGGNFRISVYSVCPVGYYGTDCSRKCYCKGEVACLRNETRCVTGECPIGWQGSACTIDVDECLSNNGGCQQNCINTPGSYYCSCNDTYTLRADNKACADNDECASNTTNSCNHKCINTPGSYHCSCWDDGYELIGRFQCEDVDECSVNKGGCEQKCNNTQGTYNCLCDDGFRLEKNNRNCTDVDECFTNNGGCEQKCNNTQGTYKCLCDDGFRLEENNRNCTVVTLKPSESWKWTAVGLILVIALCAIALLIITIYRRRGRENCTEDKPVWTALLGILHTAKSKPKINTPSNTPPDDTTRATGSDITLVADDVSRHTYQNFSQPPAKNSAICRPTNFPSVDPGFEINGMQQTCVKERSTKEPIYEILNKENRAGAIGFYTHLQK